MFCLIGCSSSPPKGDVEFRMAKAPIYSAAVLDEKKLSGQWIQVADFSEPGQSGCLVGTVAIVQGASGPVINAQLCLNGRSMRLTTVLVPRGPGRFAVAGMDDWWVLWVDSGYRTLAIGTPSGRFGFVLNRGEIAPDRLTAASEVFNFNGYTKDALNPF